MSYRERDEYDYESGGHSRAEQRYHDRRDDERGPPPGRYDAHHDSRYDAYDDRGGTQRGRYDQGVNHGYGEKGRGGYNGGNDRGGGGYGCGGAYGENAGGYCSSSGGGGYGGGSCGGGSYGGGAGGYDAGSGAYGTQARAYGDAGGGYGNMGGYGGGDTSGGKGGGGGRLSGGAGSKYLTEEQILGIIEARNNAKGSRDFDTADKLRDELRDAGVMVDDRAKTWTTSDGRSGEVPTGGGFARGDRKLNDGSIQWSNTIYVAGLPTDVTVDEIVEFFGKIGQIKKSKKSFNQGEPTVHVYKDKRTGRPKGDATISYEEVETANAAIEWFNGSTFMNRPGSTLSVSIATRPSSGGWGKGKGGGKGRY